MLKWFLLALGVFLFINGLFTRTYDYADPEQYCFQMDIIDVVGCFGSPIMPQLIFWATIIAGAGLILGCLLWARAERAQKKP